MASPTTVFNSNTRLEPTTLMFPSNLNSGLTRTINFQINKINKNTIDTSNLYEPTGWKIVLPLPTGLTDEYNISYSAENLGSILNTFREEKSGSQQFIDTSLSALGTAAASGFSRELQKVGFSNKTTEAGLALGRAFGYQLNPGLFNNFSGFGFKEHAYIFILVAKNEEESRTIADIIGIFRYFSAPSGQSSGFLTRPEAFNITYGNSTTPDSNSAAPDIPYLYKPGVCALKSMSITYNPTKSAFFKNGAPVEVAFVLQFVELQQAYKERLAGDYPRYTETAIKAESSNSNTPNLSAPASSDLNISSPFGAIAGGGGP